MLSISPPMAAGQGGYYVNLAREDYYLEAAGEPLGVWFGRGAQVLGLSGAVERDPFTRVFSGFDPTTHSEGGAPVPDRRLVQNAGKPERQCGWDLTFSAPKSVSVLWALADSDLSSAVRRAHDEAVKSALRYLEEVAGYSRVGARGERVRASLVFALFEHGTSRALDPQLHTHALLLNVGLRQGGTGSLESREIFRHKMAAGALYRADLSARLDALGVSLVRRKNWFEVDSIPRELVVEFSKRRREVLDQLDLYGAHSAKAAKIAALDTRSEKECLPRAELFARWQQLTREMGIDPAAITQLEPPPRRDVTDEVSRAISRAKDSLLYHQSHFSERELVRLVAEAAQTRGVSAEAVRETVAAHLAGDTRIVRLKAVREEPRFTTVETLVLEERLLQAVRKQKGTLAHRISETARSAALSAYPKLSPEQKLALHQVTSGTDSIACLFGMAGTGKSHLLAAAKRAWEIDGYQVLGAALSGKAAQNLEAASGIACQTLHSLIAALDTQEKKLEKDSVLVVDEAGMVGTRQMAMLVESTRAAGAKLVLVGDWNQLQAIEAGGPFRAIAKETGYASLTEIRRQDEEWMRDAIRLVAEGRGPEALSHFAARGLLSVCETPDEASTDLLQAWAKEGLTAPAQNLILCASNEDAAKLNRAAQSMRLHLLGRDQLAAGTAVLHEGDRVLFTRNRPALGVQNGALGTVERIDSLRREIWAKLDSGANVFVPLATYGEENLRLGYAVTTHKAQGTTVRNSFVLLGGPLQDRELAYVQASRASAETRLFADRFQCGEELLDLERQFETSRQKDLALTHDREEQARARTRVEELERLLEQARSSTPTLTQSL